VGKASSITYYNCQQHEVLCVITEFDHHLVGYDVNYDSVQVH